MIKKSHAVRQAVNERLLFFKSALRNPKALGAILPSSRALMRVVAHHIMRHNSRCVIEVGAGTGSFARELLDMGFDPKGLTLVEMNAEMCQFLQQRFPGVTVIEGDAMSLATLLPPELIGRTSTIVSGIPLINLSRDEKDTLFQSYRDVLCSEGCILQFTYGPVSPVAHRRFGLDGKRVGFILRNLPPATVWAYRFHKNSHATVANTSDKKSDSPLRFSRVNLRHNARKTAVWIRNIKTRLLATHQKRKQKI